MNTNTRILRETRFGQPIAGPECLIEEVRMLSAMFLNEEQVRRAIGPSERLEKIFKSEARKDDRRYFLDGRQLNHHELSVRWVQDEEYFLEIRPTNTGLRDPWSYVEEAAKRIRGRTGVTAEPLGEIRLHLPFRHELKLEWLLNHLPAFLERCRDVERLLKLRSSDTADFYRDSMHKLLLGEELECGFAFDRYRASFCLKEYRKWYPAGPDRARSDGYSEGLLAFRVRPEVCHQSPILGEHEDRVRQVALRIARHFLSMTE